MGVDVLTIDGTPLDCSRVRPDYVVNVTGARVGYVGSKARGRKVPTTWTSGHTRESSGLRRYRFGSHPWTSFNIKLRQAL